MEGPRSFAKLVTELGDGECQIELSKALHELVQQLREEALRRGPQGVSKAALTLTLALTAEARGVVTVAYEVKAKPPARLTTATTYWVTKGGNLSAENPRQANLPLHEVEAPRVHEIEDVRGGPPRRRTAQPEADPRRVSSVSGAHRRHGGAGDPGQPDRPRRPVRTAGTGRPVC